MPTFHEDMLLQKKYKLRLNLLEANANLLLVLLCYVTYVQSNKTGDPCT